MSINYLNRQGRRVAFHLTGSPAASRAVLFLHAAPGSGSFDPDPAATATRDVLLIGVDRPGYGGSDRGGGDWPTVGDAADDAAAVLAELGVERAGAVGWSAGGRVALALAARYPDLVDRIAVVGTPAPNAEVAWVSPEQAQMVEDLRPLPPEEGRARLAAIMGQAFGGQHSDDWWLDFVGSARTDGAVLDDPAVRGRLVQTLRYAMRSGVEGMSDDVGGYCLRPWGFEPEEVRAKTLLLYGAADDVVKPAHARWWQARLPSARVEMMPGVGHLLIVPGWARVLAHLAPGTLRTAGADSQRARAR